jgi:hypothetical protein
MLKYLFRTASRFRSSKQDLGNYTKNTAFGPCHNLYIFTIKGETNESSGQ